MPDIPPKLRSDLEFRSESSGPASAIIVKDPIARRFYRFTAVQAAVLGRLNGIEASGAIAQAVSQECKTEVLQSQIETFAEKLRGLLLLDDPACWAKLQGASGSADGFLKNILSIKIRAFNPDALLGRLEEKLRFCFSKGFAAWVCLTMFVALNISILNWEFLFVSFGTLFQLYSVPLILGTALAILTIHEFAHGLTLKHYGGRVEEMGFLLLYFIPAFYCNVSDAWMLKKRERMLVTLAGGFVQLFLWALATIAWRLLSPETVLSRICLIAIAFSGIQTLFNFNPLIRLDGYYLLADYLEIPNLRPRAYGFLKKQFSGWLLGTQDRTVAGPSANEREKRIYWRYGISSFFFSAGLLWVMVDRLGGWLIREYQMWGMLVISAIGLMSVQTIAEKGGPAATLRFFAALMERVRKTPRMLLALAVVGLGSLLPWELKVAGDFTIRSSERVSVSSQVEGTLKVVNADEGSKVKPGDLLAEIENFELENELGETRGELATKTATLRLLKAGARPEEIERAKRQVETKEAEFASISRVEKERDLLQETVAKKKAEVRNAQEVYERSKQLLDSGLISRNDFERDRTAYEVHLREVSEAQSQLGVLAETTDRLLQVKKKEVGEAESALNILLAGSRKEAIEASAAEVAKLEEKLKILEQQLQHLRVRSSIEGVVSTPYLRNRTGEYLKKGDFFCEIVNPDLMIIEMPVPEKEIADVRVGQPITLKVRGFSHRSFEGKVASISPVAIESGMERRVLVQSVLSNSDQTLKAGMTGVGKILCGKRMIAYLVTRRATRWLRTEFWEYLP